MIPRRSHQSPEYRVYLAQHYPGIEEERINEDEETLAEVKEGKKSKGKLRTIVDSR